MNERSTNAASDDSIVQDTATAAKALNLKGSGAKKMTAVDRLKLSRAEMRVAMTAIVHPPPQPPLWSGSSSLRSTAMRLLDGARSVPGVSSLIDRSNQHIGGRAGHAADIAGGKIGAPLFDVFVRANPRNALLISAGVGGLFILVRPWRVVLRPKFLLGLLAPVTVFALKRVPTHVWLGLATSAAKRGLTGAKVRRAT